jgi:hypothetical protein
VILAGGPTLLRPGSHIDTALILAVAGDRGLEWAEAAVLS